MSLTSGLKGKKILLMDRDEFIRGSMALFLDGEGCGLTPAKTAKEGLEALKAENYEIIICDHCLPDMDALDFFHSIQSSHPAAVKVLMTCGCRAELAGDVHAAGIDGVIEKPFTAEGLQNDLVRLLEKRSMQALPHQGCSKGTAL